jgi:TRAP-type C4-dicarboxylate transport system permease small subunit
MVQRKICAVLLLGTIAVTTIQIVARVFFHAATPWTEEVAKTLIMWVTFIGGTGMLMKGEHLVVDFLSSMYTPAMKKIARIVFSGVYTFFSCFMLVFGSQLLMNPFSWRAVIPALLIPRGWQYMVIPLCMVFMLTYSLYELTLSIKAVFKDNKTLQTEENEQ